jgi:hypothetical protein
MAEIDLSNENLRDLEAIRNIITIEDGRDTSLDEVLSRVLDFYRGFVPYS